MAIKLSTTKVEYTVIALSELFKKKVIPKIYVHEIRDAVKNMNPDGISSEVFYVSLSRLGSFICDDDALDKLEKLDESFGDSIVHVDLNN
jgi:hypothetical protein